MASVLSWEQHRYDNYWRTVQFCTGIGVSSEADIRKDGQEIHAIFMDNEVSLPWSKEPTVDAVFTKSSQHVRNLSS